MGSGSTDHLWSRLRLLSGTWTHHTLSVWEDKRMARKLYQLSNSSTFHGSLPSEHRCMGIARVTGRDWHRGGGLECWVYCSITMYQKENLIPIELCSGVQRRRLGGGRGPLSMYKLFLVAWPSTPQYRSLRVAESVVFHVRGLLYQPMRSHQMDSPSTTLTWWRLNCTTIYQQIVKDKIFTDWPSKKFQWSTSTDYLIWVTTPTHR